MSNSEHIGEVICEIAMGNIDAAEEISERLRELETTWFVGASLKSLTKYIDDYRTASLVEKDSFVIFGPFIGEGIPLGPVEWVAILTMNIIDIVVDPHVEKPEPTLTPSPKYPWSARKEGIQGRSTVLAHIETDGTVFKVETKSSSGNWAIDDAALECVRKWKFTPARVLGVPITFQVSVPINFSLVDKME